VNENPVVVIAAGNVPADTDLDLVLMFILRFLEDLEVLNAKYSIVYVATELPGAATVSTMWARDVVAVLHPKYRKNLSRLWVLHPTITTRMVITSLQTMTTAKATKKLVYCDTVNELLDNMHSRRLILPDYVYRKEGSAMPSLMGDSRGANLMITTRRILWDDTIVRQQRKRRQTLLTRDKESLEFFKEHLATLLTAGRYDDAKNVEDDIAALEVEIRDLQTALAKT